MKKKTALPNVKGKPQPRMDWQVDEYDRFPEVRLVLPYQFLLLCRLVDKPPLELINDFMHNLSHGSYKREGRGKLRKLLRKYFLLHGYGQHRYTKKEIYKLFSEMNAVGLLFPQHAPDKLSDLYCQWRTEYHHFWFNKWFGKNNRRHIE